MLEWWWIVWPVWQAKWLVKTEMSHSTVAFNVENQAHSKVCVCILSALKSHLRPTLTSWPLWGNNMITFLCLLSVCLVLLSTMWSFFFSWHIFLPDRSLNNVSILYCYLFWLTLIVEKKKNNLNVLQLKKLVHKYLEDFVKRRVDDSQSQI